MIELSVCGVNCQTDCHAYLTDCAGCVPLDGKVSWAAFYGLTHCPIWLCVRDKGLPSCKECGLAPCEVWDKTRNPDATDAEFAADIANRLKNLKQQ